MSLTIYDLLKGKHMLVETNMKVIVELEIKEVEEITHSQNLEEATQKNDWWPKSNDWSTFKVTFTNGATKEYNSITQIKVH